MSISWIIALLAEAEVVLQVYALNYLKYVALRCYCTVPTNTRDCGQLYPRIDRHVGLSAVANCSSNALVFHFLFPM